MIVLRGFAGSWDRVAADTALAVGVFDGLHSGHRSVLEALGRHAGAHGVLPGVVTFDPHPLAVVAPDRAPLMITDVDQRLELLAAAGAGLVAVVAFDEATREWSPEDFAIGLLATTLRARVVLAGEDFRFARDRAGDLAALVRLGAEGGFEAVGVPLVGADALASSRALRGLIAAGEVGAVAAELGRPHEVRGAAAPQPDHLVVEVPAGIALPAPGEYSGNVARRAGEGFPAIISVGATLAVHPMANLRVGPGDPVRVRFVDRLPTGGDITAWVRSQGS